MKKAVFITNEKYVNPNSPEGGVKYCTSEYITLLSTHFKLLFFNINTKNTFSYRLKKRLGLSAYEDFDVLYFADSLQNLLATNSIDTVFLNMTNTVVFAPFIKRKFPNCHIILCSHGNESGDSLHDLVRYEQPGRLKKILATYSLGKMLRVESYHRNFIDLVLTVSEVELNIEKWIGAKKVYMVPRIIKAESVVSEPVKGRVGFFGDLSHPPNFHGVLKLCEALTKLDTSSIEIRIVSSDLTAGKLLEKFTFISYLGYLPGKELEIEVSTWTFCLNPVLYYSRGVSTKLGKALGMGIPVITTYKGMRGYQWSEGEILACESEKEMAAFIIQYAGNINDSNYYRAEVKKIQQSSPSKDELMKDIQSLLAQ